MSTTVADPRRERPATMAAAGRGEAGGPRRVAFWLLALVFAAVMLGTTLPTPLYVIYQAQWHFSAAMVTVIFAVYAAGVLVTLLLAGRSSDQAGRKPVLAVALGASALSTVVFILAPDVGALLAARIISGLSAGLMTGTATAALTELIPAAAGRRASLVATAANMGGLGLGPLVAGLFAQYAPHPTTLVFQVYLAVLAAAGLCLLLIPETVSPRQRPALRLAGTGHPRAGPGRVHRRGGRVLRLLPARAVRRAGAHLPRKRAARGQPRRPGRRGVPAVRGGYRRPGPAVQVPQPRGYAWPAWACCWPHWP